MSEALTRGHHPYSPSSLQARAASRFWANRVSENTEASTAGTLQHDATDGDIHLDDPTLTDTQAEAVVDCQRYRDNILASKYPGGKKVSEVYLPIDDKVILDDEGRAWVGTTGGYLDCALISADETEADILDWKFGLWSVEPAKTNLQGHSYLLGLVKKFPKLKRVTVHFVMPHRDEIDFHTFERDEFEGLYLGVVLAVHRAVDAKADEKRLGVKALEDCSMTTSSCLFCGNIGRCPLVAKTALVIGKKYAPVKVPDSIDVTLISSDVTQVKYGMELASLVATWAKAFRTQVTEKAIEDDTFIPEGYKLVSKSDREIVDEALFIKTAVEEFGVSKEAIEATKTLPLTPIGKLIRDTAERGKKELKEKEFVEATINNGAAKRGQPYSFLERLKS